MSGAFRNASGDEIVLLQAQTDAPFSLDSQFSFLNLLVVVNGILQYKSGKWLFMRRYK